MLRKLLITCSVSCLVIGHAQAAIGPEIKRLDLLCSSERIDVGMALLGLSYPLDPATRDHALELAEGGCGRAVWTALSAFPQDALPQIRRQIVQGALRHVDPANDFATAQALEAISQAIEGPPPVPPPDGTTPELPFDAPLAAWADEQILPKVDSIIAANGDLAPTALARLFWHPANIPSAREGLLKIVERSRSGREQALEILRGYADPNDLSPLTPWLVSGDGTAEDEDERLREIESLNRVLGPAAAPLLIASMTESPSWRVRDRAALDLASETNPDATAHLIDVLQTAREPEVSFIVSALGPRVPPGYGSDAERAIAYFHDRLGH